MWTTTVQDIIEIFRSAMIAIIPSMEKAKIRWKGGETYDDWDNIATALYENIVCASLYSEIQKNYPIARYDLHYEDYSDLDFILINCQKHPNENFALISFQTKFTAFDAVEVAKLDNFFRKIETVVLENDNLDFAFAKKGKGGREYIKGILVTL